MSQIRGYAIHAAGAEVLPYKYEAGELGDGEIEVKISHCGVCQSDIHLMNNDWHVSQYPFVPGHEIVGTVTAMGPTVRGLKTGDRVGVGWQADSCRHCEWCLRGEEHLCQQAQRTCVHRNGGFAEAIRVPAHFAIPIPESLESESVAPLLCAGITVYTPMRTHGINPSSRVGVIGIGGLGHLALQFARIFGAEVTAFSASQAKEAEAKTLGAHHFCNTRESKGVKAIAGSFDFILSTVDADQDWAGYIAALRPKGLLCLLGAPPKPPSIAAATLVVPAKTISGSNTGSPVMMREMLDIAARHGVKAQTERFAMAKVNDAIAKVKKGAVRYRAVLAN
jgi:alcohol/geraniol dehydrogenase (NADP+)